MNNYQLGLMSLPMPLNSSHISSTESNVSVSIRKAWAAINRLTTIQISDHSDQIKQEFFQAIAMTVLLYGCTTWTLMKCLKNKLDGNYIRILHAVLNKSWKKHLIKQQLDGHLPPISQTIYVRWTRHAGHCWGSKDEIISNILLWTPTYGHTSIGWPAKTYIH